MYLDDVAIVSTNLISADFWLIRKGSIKQVGKPVREFKSSHIGITVVETEILLPNYLFYTFMALHMKGEFQKIAEGTLALKHIRVGDIKKIRLG